MPPFTDVQPDVAALLLKAVREVLRDELAVKA